MTNISYKITHLLEKMTSLDKDFRFMATSDLLTFLQEDSIKLDIDSERQVVKMLLNLLEDKNGEVKNMAVKCLGFLIKQVRKPQLETIVASLCVNMASSKEQLRDISSVCLKIVITELPQEHVNLSIRIAEMLIKALESEDASLQLEVLDIITVLLIRFGLDLKELHSSMVKALFPQLCSPRQAVRKRTIAVFSKLVLSCNQTIYNQLIQLLYEGLSSNDDSSLARTYLQCAAAVCRQSGHKFAEHIGKFFPLIVQYCDVEDDELRECCFQAFENFISRCPKEISKDVLEITNLCMKYMVYDPNYNYDSDECCEDEEYDEYSDDDDMSWKIRKSATKCLETIITVKCESLSGIYKTLFSFLIFRFKEREENVRTDILHVYMALIKQAKSTVDTNTPSNDTSINYEEDSLLFHLQQHVDPLVRAVQKVQVRANSLKTRQDCYHLLKELCTVLPGALSNFVNDLLPGIIDSLNEKMSDNTVKLDALSFIYCLLRTHRPEVFHPYIGTLVPLVINTTKDSFYKITARALNVLQELVKVIRPMSDFSGFDFTPFTKDIYLCTFAHLKVIDVDLEVKEKAISTMGQVICNLGDHLVDELPDCLTLLLDRLGNETTRLTTIKILIQIVDSPLGIKLSILPKVMPILEVYLRKNQRALKLAALQLLESIIKTYHKDLDGNLLKPIISEISQLLHESDLQVTQKAFVVLKLITVYHPISLGNIDSILPQVLVLVQSPLLQGAVLQSMIDFFSSLVRNELPDMNFDALLKTLMTPFMNLDLIPTKNLLYNVAKCVAAITVARVSRTNHMVSLFISEFKNASSDDERIFMLYVLGEIGRKMDLSSTIVSDIVFESFASKSEDIKSSASYALGGVCVGNLEHYLPLFLSYCEAHPNDLYLLLSSLKVALTGLLETEEGKRELVSQALPIWEHLYNFCDCFDEGNRCIAAECFAKLVLFDPEKFLPMLKLYLKSSSSTTRSTAVAAITFTISDQPALVDSSLKQCIGEFLTTLKDPDINVQRVALVAFNTAAHNKPSLIRDLLDTFLPEIYEHTTVKNELIREVEMGPFKHTVDDGLDVRKLAFGCLYTLLESCFDRLDIFEFINYVERGLTDHYDIKLLMHHLVLRLLHICPGEVFQVMDKLLVPLRATLTLNVKTNSVRQEHEKLEELKKSAEQVIAALLNINATAC